MLKSKIKFKTYYPQNLLLKFGDKVLWIFGPGGLIKKYFSSNFILKKHKSVLYLFVFGQCSAVLLGTSFMRSLSNCFLGVTIFFKFGLRLKGIGYKMQVFNRKIIIKLGYSHWILIKLPLDCRAYVNGSLMLFKGICLQKISQLVYKIINLKKIDVYKGKGFNNIRFRFLLKSVK